MNITTSRRRAASAARAAAALCVTLSLGAPGRARAGTPAPLIPPPTCPPSAPANTVALHDLTPGRPEVFASTDPFMAAAIARFDAGYSPIRDSHSGAFFNYNALLPPELAALGFTPAEKMMRHWYELIFCNSARSGLIPILTTYAPRRSYDAATDSWLPASGGYPRVQAVTEGTYTSAVGTLARMTEFLGWFPKDAYLAERSALWADAVRTPNGEGSWYGHSVKGRWTLYNHVHAGPPVGASPGTTDPELRHRFAHEGFPDGSFTNASEYGALARAFERLSHLGGDPVYATFAATVTDGLWRSRFNPSLWVAPHWVTPLGPVPDDPHPVTGEYTYDTDSLYWARALFDTYGETGGIRSDLVPGTAAQAACGAPVDAAAIACHVSLRRALVAPLLAGGYPDKYLAIGLGHTLEWLANGWDPAAEQFVRKIHHSGGPATTLLYGDALWNTLYVLLEAHRWTRDPLYLAVFDTAWKRLRKAAGAVPALDGFFAAQYAGGAVAVADVAYYQEIFLEVLVRAYEVTKLLYAPNAAYLAEARAFAAHLLGRLEQLEAAGIASCDDSAPLEPCELWSPHNGVLGRALVRLAAESGHLRRVGFVLPVPGATLLLVGPGGATTSVDVPGHHAVVYMEDGAYTASWGLPGGTPSPKVPITVAGDATYSL